MLVWARAQIMIPLALIDFPMYCVVPCSELLYISNACCMICGGCRVVTRQVQHNNYVRCTGIEVDAMNDDILATCLSDVRRQSGPA